MDSQNIIVNNNLILGADSFGNKIYSINKDYSSMLLVAPHGSGKGVCFTIPNLLFNNDSAIVHDIKMENYLLTAGFRESIGQQVFLFNPLGGEGYTHRYNPLDFLGFDEETIFNNIEKIVFLLIRQQNELATQARHLLTSLILYLAVNNNKVKSIGEVCRIISGNFIEEISQAIQKFSNKIHHFALNHLQNFLNKNDSEQNSIIRFLNSCLEPWHNPLIDYATSVSDFNIGDFKKNKITLYVGLNPCDIERLKPVMQFFYDHALDQLMINNDIYDQENKYQGVSLFLDEFYSLGKLSMLESAIGYFRGYKIRVILISSDFERIENIYGEDIASSMIYDCSYKIFYGGATPKTAHKISQYFQDRKNNIEFLTWQQVMNLQSDQEILIHLERSALASKFYYFNEEEFKKKTNL